MAKNSIKCVNVMGKQKKNFTRACCNSNVSLETKAPITCIQGSLYPPNAIIFKSLSKALII